jgi:hypothetical protein
MLNVECWVINYKKELVNKKIIEILKLIENIFFDFVELK